MHQLATVKMEEPVHAPISQPATLAMPTPGQQAPGQLSVLESIADWLGLDVVQCAQQLLGMGPKQRRGIQEGYAAAHRATLVSA